MKLQDQVCTLEQAKKLKEFGVAQKGYFQWQETTNSEPYVNHTVFGESTNENEYAAFTVAELGVMLPDVNILYDKLQPLLEAKYGDVNDDNMAVFFADIFKAKEVADWLIYLLQNNHITAEQVNQRLEK